jgi:hypothetical protein
MLYNCCKEFLNNMVFHYSTSKFEISRLSGVLTRCYPFSQISVCRNGPKDCQDLSQRPDYNRFLPVNHVKIISTLYL